MKLQRLFIGLAFIIAMAFGFLHARSGSKIITADGFNQKQWMMEMNKPDLSESRLVELHAQAIAAHEPGANVQIKGPRELLVTSTNGMKLTCFMDNFIKECDAHPESRPITSTKYLQILGKSLQPQSTALPALSRLVPVIKDDRYLTELSKIMNSTNRLVSERLVADLWVLYVVDQDGQMAFLKEWEQKKLGLNLPTLRKLAVENLQDIARSPQFQSDNGVFRIRAGGDYDASFLLVDSIWEKQVSQVKGDIVATVPARGALFFTGTDASTAVELMKQKAEEVDKTGDHLIATTLLIRRSNHWEKYSD